MVKNIIPWQYTNISSSNRGSNSATVSHIFVTDTVKLEILAEINFH